MRCHLLPLRSPRSCHYDPPESTVRSWNVRPTRADLHRSSGDPNTNTQIHQYMTENTNTYTNRPGCLELQSAAHPNYHFGSAGDPCTKIDIHRHTKTRIQVFIDLLVTNPLSLSLPPDWHQYQWLSIAAHIDSLASNLASLQLQLRIGSFQSRQVESTI